MSVCDDAIAATYAGAMTYCKFLSANDTGENGSHQAGIYVAKRAASILFENPGERGANMDRRVRIVWPRKIETDSRFIYYGRGTRNEYRITNFGPGFPWLTPEHTGSLFALVRQNAREYLAFVLDTDEEMELYMQAVGIGPAETNRLLQDVSIPLSVVAERAIDEYVANWADFPPTGQLAETARRIWAHAYDSGYVRSRPDFVILSWIGVEYRIFWAFEQALFGDKIAAGFKSMNAFLGLALNITNRRKSRAGSSLEHHLAAIFDGNGIAYSAQGATEGKRKPDFMFPSIAAYHNREFPVQNLIMLAVKTTCKDRWRQILAEAPRLDGRPKYLFTMQQGISSDQMDEMSEHNVRLVAPKAYIYSYPADRRDQIWTLEKFLDFAKRQNG